MQSMSEICNKKTVILHLSVYSTGVGHVDGIDDDIAVEVDIWNNTCSSIINENKDGVRKNYSAFLLTVGHSWLSECGSVRGCKWRSITSQLCSIGKRSIGGHGSLCTPWSELPISAWSGIILQIMGNRVPTGFGRVPPAAENHPHVPVTQ